MNNVNSVLLEGRLMKNSFKYNFEKHEWIFNLITERENRYSNKKVTEKIILTVVALNMLSDVYQGLLKGKIVEVLGKIKQEVQEPKVKFGIYVEADNIELSEIS